MTNYFLRRRGMVRRRSAAGNVISPPLIPFPLRRARRSPSSTKRQLQISTLSIARSGTHCQLAPRHLSMCSCQARPGSGELSLRPRANQAAAPRGSRSRISPVSIRRIRIWPRPPSRTSATLASVPMVMIMGNTYARYAPTACSSRGALRIVPARSHPLRFPRHHTLLASRKLPSCCVAWLGTRLSRRRSCRTVWSARLIA